MTLAAHIAEQVARAPTLTPDQLQSIARALRAQKNPETRNGLGVSHSRKEGD